MDAEEAPEWQDKIILDNKSYKDALEIKHREKLACQKKFHSEAIEQKNSHIRTFMDCMSAMQQMFNELIEEVMDSWQMVWITDKDMPKFREWARALADEHNSK